MEKILINMSENLKISNKFCELQELRNTPTKFNFWSSSNEKVENKYVSTLWKLLKIAVVPLVLT